MTRCVQLIKETRVPCEPGCSEKVDSVYVRNGVADVFMISEPLAGRRETVVTETRTAEDFAKILKYTSDVLYPRTKKIILVTDNLNTHTSPFHRFQRNLVVYSHWLGNRRPLLLYPRTERKMETEKTGRLIL